MAYIIKYSLQWIRNNISVVTNQRRCGLIINIETYQSMILFEGYLEVERTYDDKKYIMEIIDHSI